MTKPCPCRKPGCRRARPLCASMAKKSPRYKPCYCSAYHYPHRNGSGLCFAHPEHQKRQWEAFTGEPWSKSA